MGAALWCLFLPSTIRAQHQTGTFDDPVVGGVIPYQIDLNEISLAPAEVPNIHSMAAAEWNHQWVFLSGRTNGLHSMRGNGAFDPADSNFDIWVIDPKTKQSWHKNIQTSTASGLTGDQEDILSAVNTQFYHDGENLLIVGGYGYKRSVSNWVTYDSLSVINLPGIVAWVKEVAGSETSQAADHIEQVTDSYFQVTGGGLELIGDEYQLIFGQNYTGVYRPFFNGVYTKQVRRFKIDQSDGLSVPAASKLTTAQDDAYRRRDLNVTAMLHRGDSPNTFVESAVALSGVFTVGGGVFTVPVVIEAGGQVGMPDPAAADTMKQAFQIYHSAKVGLYHRATDEMHMVLFGGITVQEYDTVNAVWTADDLAPFTNQCGVVVSNKNRRFKQYYLPTRFPMILSDGKEVRFGANAEFFYSEEAPMLHSKVIDLAAIREPMVIGYVFGGLISDAGNDGNTGASGRIFEVTLTPNLPQPPRQSIIWTNQLVGLQWQSDAQSSYLIEHSSNLTDWNEFLPTIPGDGELLDWSETRTDSKHFYRVLGGLITRELPQ